MGEPNMNQQLRVVCFVLLALIAPAGRMEAQNVVVSWSAFHAGGGRAATPQLFLAAAYGQAVVGRATAGNTVLEGGFLATRILLGPTTEISEQLPSGLPMEFRLSQNYPNPFNPSTTFEYALAKATHVVLRIYNVLGEEVATLVSQDQEPGHYKTSFDAGALSSGVYLYTLVTNDFVQTKRLMLLK